jgi:hypothetical protein
MIFSHLMTRFHLKRANGIINPSIIHNSMQQQQPLQQQSQSQQQQQQQQHHQQRNGINIASNSQLGPSTNAQTFPKLPSPPYLQTRPVQIKQLQLPSISKIYSKASAMTNSIKDQKHTNNTAPVNIQADGLLLNGDRYPEVFDLNSNEPPPSSENLHIKRISPNSRSMVNKVSYFFEEESFSNHNELDRMQRVSMYHSELYSSYNGSREVSKRAFAVPSMDRTREINKILFADSSEYLDPVTISKHAKHAWWKLEHLNNAVHRASFDLEICNCHLAATIIYLGMSTAIYDHKKFEPSFRRIVASIRSILVFNDTVNGIMNNLGYFQALALLSVFNYNVTYNIKEEYFYPVLEDVYAHIRRYASLGGVFESETGRPPELHLGNAYVNSDAYTFLPSKNLADLHSQWMTWIKHESIIRIVHFINGCEGARNFITQSPVEEHILSSDLIMVCPLSLWKATSAEVFFHTVGPTRTIATIPLLSLLKSMLRIPSIGEDGTKVNSMDFENGRCCWTFCHLYIVLLGLCTIGWIVEGCRYYQHMFSTLTSKKEESRPSVLVDSHIQGRISYALETWADYASKAQFQSLGEVGPDGLVLLKCCGLSSIADDAYPQRIWEGITSLCITFQACYYSMYSDREYGTKIVMNLMSNLRELAITDTSSWLDSQIETFAMFGTCTPSQKAIDNLTVWAKKNLACNKITTASFFVWNLVNTESAKTFTGCEIACARELLLPACVIVWAYTFQQRLLSSVPHVGNEYNTFYKLCIHAPQNVDAESLLTKYENILFKTFKTTQMLLDPNSNDTSKLRKELADQLPQFNLVSFMGLMSHLDKTKLNMDPLCPENDLIKLAKIVYPLR